MAFEMVDNIEPDKKAFMIIGSQEIFLLLIIVIIVVVIWFFFFRGHRQQQQHERKNMRACPKCSMQIDEDVKFCTDCGFKFTQ